MTTSKPTKRRSPKPGGKFAVPEGAFERLWDEGWRFPLRVHRARSYFHWSQADLARAAGLSEQTVSAILSADRQASFFAAGAIIRALPESPCVPAEPVRAIVGAMYPRVLGVTCVPHYAFDPKGGGQRTVPARPSLGQ